MASAVLADNPPAYRPAYKAPAYETYPDEAPVYEFNYNVYNNGQGYEHQAFQQDEARDNYNTNGEYRVELADGRTQIVTYKVEGDSGFIADVRYEGEAKYEPYHPKPAYKPEPAYKPVYKPVYKQPEPVYYRPAPTYKTTTTEAPTTTTPYAPETTKAPEPTYPSREYGPVKFNPFG